MGPTVTSDLLDMIVVFDSNIWISELGLRSSVASAVKFYLKREGARIGIPEVVRAEASAGLKRYLLNSIIQIQAEHRKLLAGFGKLRDIALPPESEIDSVVEKFYTSLQADILDIPLSVDSSRSALQKCIAKEPPCDKSEEFRDAIIWADCIELLSLDEVFLVTADKAFYQDRKHENGLAQNLIDELEGKSHQLHIFPSLSSLLATIKKPVSIDVDVLVSQYLTTGPEILDAENLKFSTVGPTKIEVFSTEDANQLYFKFELGLICSDTSGCGLSDVLLTVVGEGTYDMRTQSTTMGHLWKEGLSWLSSDRSHVAKTRVYCSGTVYLGHSEIAHTVRHQLGDGN